MHSLDPNKAYAGVLQTIFHQKASLCTGSPLPPEIRERSLALLTTATVDVSPCEQHRHITNTTQTLDTLKDQSCVILSSKYAKNQAKLMLYNGLNHKKKVYLIKLSISISKRSSSSKLYFFYLKNPFCLVKSDLSQ